MSVFKRYRRKRTKRGDKEYNLATWVAEGQVDGQRYNVALPKESIKTAEQARAAEDEIKSAIRNGEFLLKKDKTRFSEYVEADYLPFVKQNSLHYKVKTYECATLTAFFKNDLLRSITPSRCEAYKRLRKSQNVRCQKCENGKEHKCPPRPVGNSTVNRELVTLKSILTRAQADRKIRDNPMAFVPLLPEPPPRERFLTDDERVRLVAALQNNFQLFCIVMIGLLTGIRKNQILQLRIADIDFHQQSIWAPAQKRKPRRLVHVPPNAWDALMQLAQVREDWLFINRSGERLTEFNPAWWKALEQAGIKNFRFHDLRHTFATELLPHVGAFGVQRALGHSRVQTTQGYAHVKDEHLREGLDALKGGVFGNDHKIITASDEVM